MRAHSSFDHILIHRWTGIIYGNPLGNFQVACAGIKTFCNKKFVYSDKKAASLSCFAHSIPLHV